jgi:hypothetical protein
MSPILPLYLEECEIKWSTYGKKSKFQNHNKNDIIELSWQFCIVISRYADRLTCVERVKANVK